DRGNVRESKKNQLQARVEQFNDEIRGLEAQRMASRHELSLIEDELNRCASLLEKGLIERSRVSQLEREATNAEGMIGQLTADIAGAREKISETALQISQVDEDRAAEVGTDLREMDARIGEYVERKVTAEDQLKRVDIVAPQTGTVHQLAVHTVGGVISPGEPVMMIVPQVDKL